MKPKNVKSPPRSIRRGDSIEGKISIEKFLCFNATPNWCKLALKCLKANPSQWERGFLTNPINRLQPTPHQLDWLTDTADRLGVRDV